MESKYYTPTIEEWHVDFEYEQRREIWDRSYLGIKVLEYIWEPVIGNLGQFKEGIDPDRKEKHYRFTNGQLGFGAYSNMIRVKYLDKEDIESLGWEYSEDRGMEENYGIQFIKPITYLSGGNVYYRLRFWFNNKRLRIDSLGGNIFDGTIKNKSELKILLKQLGIE